jgi:hypothetical protein
MKHMTRAEITEKYGRDAKLALAARGWGQVYYTDATRTQAAGMHDVREAVSLTAKFFTDATVVYGIVRWDTNGSIPPKDILALWDSLGFEFDYDATLAASKKDFEEAMDRYCATYTGPAEEELFEMRAAFGPGETVVDLITGAKITL